MAAWGSVQTDIFVGGRHIVDAAIGWRDPTRHLAGLAHAPHEAAHKSAILFRGHPIALSRPPGFGGDRISLRIGVAASPGADGAPEPRARYNQPEIVTGLLDQPVPA